MDNFVQGLSAVLGGAKDTIFQLSSYPLLWGFVTGFLTSAIVSVFIMSGQPRHMRAVLFESKSEGFQKIYPPRPNGQYTKSYAEYSRAVDRTKITLLTGFLGITILLLIVALTR